MRSTKIFISAGPTDDTEREWANAFADAIRLAGRYQDDEVYLYLNQRVGQDIPQEVRQKIKESRRMICLLSDHYLESGWCALEHYLFCSKGPEYRQNCVGVIQPYLRRWVGRTDAQREKIVGDAVDFIKEDSVVDLTSEVLQHLDEQWTAWLLRSRHCDDFYELKAWPENVDDDLSEALRKLAEPSSPWDPLLQRTAALSAFAVAADRYHDGGWGFSLGDCFDYDDSGGDELPRGRFDLNVVILRTLSEFLGQKTLEGEWDTIFGSNHEGRQQKVRVDDRLPLLAGLLASLSGGDALKGYNQTDGLTEQRGGSLADSRWVLQDAAGSGDFEYNSTLLVCLNKLLPALEDFPRPVQRKLAKVEREIKESQQIAEAAVAAYVRENNLFAVALASATEEDGRASAQPALTGDRNRLRLAALWLLLMLSEDTAAGLGRELRRAVAAESRWSNASFDVFFTTFESLVKADRPSPEAVTLLLACAAILSAEGINVSELHTERMQRTVLALLRRSDWLRILLSLNVIAWTSLILFALRISIRKLDVSLLRAMWAEGRQLREKRLSAIEGKSVEEIRGAIDEQIARCARETHKRWNPPRAPDGTLATVTFDAFLTDVRAATFWGPRVNEPGSPGGFSQEGTLLSGVLRVRAKTKQVELETPGYNQMFLHPFSMITGMDILNLRNLQREFGDEDSKLVRLMGETVVSKCYERFQDDFIESSRTFEERTQYITDRLASPEWDATKGFDDLLVVKKGVKGERWVYRTALVHQRGGATGASGEDALISWRFTEMPPSVRTLIREGARIKEFPNDLRPSA